MEFDSVLQIKVQDSQNQSEKLVTVSYVLLM